MKSLWKVVMADPKCFRITQGDSSPLSHTHHWRQHMKKSFLLTGAMLALSASLAVAQGINLSFVDCGLAGNRFATSTCNSNIGAPEIVVGSFVPPAGLTEFLGLNAQVDVTTAGALPDWWKHGATSCRGTGGLSV